MAVIRIKNMVCPRCIETVRETLVFLNVHILSIDLGEVVIDRELSGEELIQLQTKLISKGFELLEDRNAILVDKVKSTIIEHIHYNKGELKVNFSTVLSETLDQDYTKLSKLFSNAEGITIEKFINKQKIEKVKELIEYNELNLSEIAFHLNYSSLAHLSSQFKKETGMTPSTYKKLEHKERNTLDAL